jgi:chromosome segregation ATPase
MGAERDGLYAEIDEARAAVIQLEDELDKERETQRETQREKMGLERQLSLRLEEIAALKSAETDRERHIESERERSPRFQELTNLAADDAVFQMQVKELEGELQSAHAQLAERH